MLKGLIYLLLLIPLIFAGTLYLIYIVITDQLDRNNEP